MKFVGKLLTKSERDRVKNPFAKNHGEKLPLHRIGKYVQDGMDAIGKDATLSGSIKDGMKKLAQ